MTTHLPPLAMGDAGAASKPSGFSGGSAKRTPGRGGPGGLAASRSRAAASIGGHGTRRAAGGTTQRMGAGGARGVATRKANQQAFLAPDTANVTGRHAACINTLREGFVESFAELFALTEQPPPAASGVSEAEHLETLQVNLTRAEAARRRGEAAVVLDAHQALASHFERLGDLQATATYRAACVTDATQLQDAQPRLLAEALCSLGLVRERQGQNDEALDCFQNMHTVCKEHNLDGPTSCRAACTHLVRVLTAGRGDRDTSDPAAQIELLMRGLAFANETGNIGLINQVNVRLGYAHEQAGDYPTAVEYLKKYMDNRDADGMAEPADQDRACAALSRCYEHLGDPDTAHQYLTRLVETSFKSEQFDITMHSASRLGHAMRKKGDENGALKWYAHAYEVAKRVDDPAAMAAAKVELAMARAAVIAPGFTTALARNTIPDVARLLQWKSLHQCSFPGVVAPEEFQPKAAPITRAPTKAQLPVAENETEPEAEGDAEEGVAEDAAEESEGDGQEAADNAESTTSGTSPAPTPVEEGEQDNNSS